MLVDVRNGSGISRSILILCLDACGKDDSLVTYKEAEPHTTKVKKMDFSKAVRDLHHDPKGSP